MESELEQNKIDIQVSREANIKKVQNVLDEVKEEESLNVENFFDNWWQWYFWQWRDF